MRGQWTRSTVKWLALTAAGLTFLSSLAMLAIGIVSADAAFIGFATACVPASLAAVAVILGVETWADARAAALDEKSREALEQFITISATVIPNGLNLAGIDIPMRANIATWGSPQLLRKLAERTRLIDEIASEFAADVERARELAGDPDATVVVDIGDRKAQLAQLTAEAVALARAELGLVAVSPAEVYGVLYGSVNGLRYDEIPPIGTPPPKLTTINDPTTTSS
ncbi:MULTISPECIES: hypothetical protein [unclassified Microbacterium]|uniref:hypothetical protein n=1 Tax=unclassified Microbacterium TaxID=2609290 RepID=UPI000F8813AA|nr:hypothetical protein [Microbacterium sp. HSID17254]RUQ03113.1 hypothetical protein D8M34_17150 [Microbacterium sp. HSID17254]